MWQREVEILSWMAEGGCKEEWRGRLLGRWDVESIDQMQNYNRHPRMVRALMIYELPGKSLEVRDEYMLIGIGKMDMREQKSTTGKDMW